MEVVGPIKYRNFLWLTSAGKFVVLSVLEKENSVEPRENWKGFVRWLGGWKQCTLTRKEFERSFSVGEDFKKRLASRKDA